MTTTVLAPLELDELGVYTLRFLVVETAHRLWSFTDLGLGKCLMELLNALQVHFRKPRLKRDEDL